MGRSVANAFSIIALSGLGGHAFGSFKEKGGSYMWLRDSLPYDLTSGTKPIARVMIYGYESAVVESKSMQNLEDFATKLNVSLQTLMNATTVRPIILIGHSLGGLIIKHALISLSGSENKESRTLIRAVYGVVFFGTPHHGMDISSLISMAGNGPNRSLIESLSHDNSQILTMQHREFHKALGGEGESEVFCFYETLKSPTAQQDQYGGWTMTGPDAFLVTKSSATHCRPWEDGAEHICALTRTHSEMGKFKPNESDYDIVKEKIEGLCKRAFIARGRSFDLYCNKCEELGIPLAPLTVSDAENLGTLPMMFTVTNAAELGIMLTNLTVMNVSASISPDFLTTDFERYRRLIRTSYIRLPNAVIGNED